MKIRKNFYKLLYIFLLSVGSNAAFSAQEFIIHDIRVEGLQRLTPGTVFNYMPIEVGDSFNDQISTEAVRSLFKTGFFDDVKLERDGNILVVIVKERPAIGSITIEGNKDIKMQRNVPSMSLVSWRMRDTIWILWQLKFVTGKPYKHIRS